MRNFENYKACKKYVDKLMRNLKVIEAIEALNEYIQKDSNCYKAYYYKAQLLEREENIKESIR